MLDTNAPFDEAPDTDPTDGEESPSSNPRAEPDASQQKQDDNDSSHRPSRKTLKKLRKELEERKNSSKANQPENLEKQGTKVGGNSAKGVTGNAQGGVGETGATTGGTTTGGGAMTGEGAAATGGTATGGAAAGEGAVASGTAAGTAATGEGLAAAGTVGGGAAATGTAATGTAAAGTAAAGTAAAGTAAAGTAAAGTAAAGTGAVVGVSVASGGTADIGAGVVLGIIAGLAFLLFLIVLLFVIITAVAGTEDDNKTNTLTLTKEGPAKAKAGDTLQYKINVVDTQSLHDVTIVDHLPNDVAFVSSPWKAKYNAGAKTVTWVASENLPSENGALKQSSFSIELTLKATKDNTNLVNWAEATSTYTSVQTGGAPGNATATEKNILEFYTLIAGKGRDKAVLGKEDDFVATVMKNGGSKYGLTNKETQVRQIYKQSVAANVNPLILLTIWGVESGWKLNGTEYGCIRQRGSGFPSQLNCRVREINHFMGEFEQSVAKKGLPFVHPVASQCTYTDPFVYTYEKGTPVCAVSDNNGVARKNFVSFYKTFLGTR